MHLIGKKTSLLFMLMGGLVFVFVAQSFYLISQKSLSVAQIQKKQAYTALAGLPDLALNTQTSYIRHRSLSSVASIYGIDGNLREFAYATFVYEVYP